MPLTRTRRRALRAGATLALALAGTGVAGAAANASTVTVTGDDGNPAPLTAGVPGIIRNMDPQIGVAATPTAGYFSVSVTGPDGVPVASPINCYLATSPSSRYVDYRGNGTYTVVVTAFANKSDYSCKTPTATETFAFTISAGVSLGAPGTPVLTRPVNSGITTEYALPVGLNPGAGSYEVRYAAGGVIGADGAISGPSAEAYVNTTSGTAGLRFAKPGTYVVVARAGEAGSGGTFYTPWSQPVTIVAKAPFDFSSLGFTDSRGPVYKIRGVLGESSIRGKISLALAKGKKGGKYHSIGTAKITRKGTFTKKFTQRSTGTYRLRATFKGSQYAAGGKVVALVRFTRKVVFG
jgi:hypothetical protein